MNREMTHLTLTTHLNTVGSECKMGHFSIHNTSPQNTSGSEIVAYEHPPFRKKKEKKVGA